MTVWMPVMTTVGNNDGFLLSWGPMLQGDTAQPVLETSNAVGFADRSIQVEGTFGAGGSLSIVGSNDGVNFQILNDPSSTPLTFTSARIKAMLEATRQIKPVISGGDGSTALTVSVFVRRLR